MLFGVALWLAGRASGDLAFAGLGWLHLVSPGQYSAYASVRGLVMLAAVGAAWFAPRPAVAAISLIAVAAISLIAFATDAYPWQGQWWLLGDPAMLAARPCSPWGRSACRATGSGCSRGDRLGDPVRHRRVRH